jgi:hypothetical protein
LNGFFYASTDFCEKRQTFFNLLFCKEKNDANFYHNNLLTFYSQEAAGYEHCASGSGRQHSGWRKFIFLNLKNVRFLSLCCSKSRFWLKPLDKAYQRLSKNMAPLFSTVTRNHLVTSIYFAVEHWNKRAEPGPLDLRRYVPVTVVPVRTFARERGGGKVERIYEKKEGPSTLMKYGTYQLRIFFYLPFTTGNGPKKGEGYRYYFFYSCD